MTPEYIFNDEDEEDDGGGDGEDGGRIYETCEESPRHPKLSHRLIKLQPFLNNNFSASQFSWGLFFSIIVMFIIIIYFRKVFSVETSLKEGLANFHKNNVFSSFFSPFKEWKRLNLPKWLLLCLWHIALVHARPFTSSNCFLKSFLRSYIW